MTTWMDGDRVAIKVSEIYFIKLTQEVFRNKLKFLVQHVRKRERSGTQ